MGFRFCIVGGALDEVAAVAIAHGEGRVGGSGRGCGYFIVFVSVVDFQSAGDESFLVF